MEHPSWENREAATVVRIRSGIRIRGRTFTPEELSRIKMLVETSPEEHRFALSKRVCKELVWVQPNGRLKDRSCRDVLARLHEIGFICLPGPRRPSVRRRRVEITDRSAPRPLSAFGPGDIEVASFLIVSGTGNLEQERLWNEYVERYHYLGYGVPLGPHIKYFVTVAGEPIACLCFAGAAWRVEARDRWIGWNGEQRERNLRYVVNNTRFVVFPWINVRNLASRLLALAAKRIAADWQRLYAYRPLLLETFVDSERCAGTCYRAANWLLIGYTKGRGKLDRQFKATLSKKAVLLYPLTKDATRHLRA
jgi:Druantia protein DruA